MEKKTKKLIKDILLFALGNIGSKIILFLLVPLYTTYMTTQEYGTSDLFFTIAELILPFVTLTIYDTVFRFGLSKDEKPADVLLISFIVLIVGSGITLLGTPLFSFYGAIAPWRWYLSCYLILYGFELTTANYIKVKNKNAWYSVISITMTALMAVLNILLIAKFRMGVQGYLIARIISIFVCFVFALIVSDSFTDLRTARFNKPLFKEMILFSMPMIFSSISYWVVHSSDKVMLEYMMDATALGLYTVAAKIPSLINVMINIFSQAWGISSVKEYENTNDTSFYSSVLSVYSFICFGVCIAFVAITKPFMSIYVGKDFQGSWRFVPILMVAAAFAAITYYYGTLYSTLKRSMRNMTTTVMAAVINIVVNYFGILYLGIYGAALGTLAAYLITAVVRIIDVQKFIKIEINWLKFAFTGVLALAQAVCVTLDFYGYAVSLAVIVVFIAMYRKLVVELVGKCMSFTKGFANRIQRKTNKDNAM